MIVADLFVSWGTDIPYEPVVLYRTVQNFGKILDDLTVQSDPEGTFYSRYWTWDMARQILSSL